MTSFTVENRRPRNGLRDWGCGPSFWLTGTHSQSGQYGSKRPLRHLPLPLVSLAFQAAVLILAVDRHNARKDEFHESLISWAEVLNCHKKLLSSRISDLMRRGEHGYSGAHEQTDVHLLISNHHPLRSHRNQRTARPRQANGLPPPASGNGPRFDADPRFRDLGEHARQEADGKELGSVPRRPRQSR